MEDDLFAEILNDSIIQLDECPPSSTYGTQPMVTINTTVPVVPRTYNPSHQPISPRVYPSQGTANRRMRLRKLRRNSPRKDELEEGSGENMVSSKLKQFSKGFDQGWMRVPKNCSRLYRILVTISLVILLMAYTTGPTFITNM